MLRATLCCFIVCLITYGWKLDSLNNIMWQTLEIFSSSFSEVRNFTNYVYVSVCVFSHQSWLLARECTLWETSLPSFKELSNSCFIIASSPSFPFLLLLLSFEQLRLLNLFSKSLSFSLMLYTLWFSTVLDGISSTWLSFNSSTEFLLGKSHLVFSLRKWCWAVVESPHILLVGGCSSFPLSPASVLFQ